MVTRISPKLSVFLASFGSYSAFSRNDFSGVIDPDKTIIHQNLVFFLAIFGSYSAFSRNDFSGVIDPD
jgi:hypothetical protein